MNDDVQQLLQLAGPDAHSLFLLDYCWDTPEPDIEVMLAHAMGYGRVSTEQLEMVCITLAEAVHGWDGMPESDTDILDSLARLRDGDWPCEFCLHRAANVTQIRPRRVGSLYCAQCAGRFIEQSTHIRVVAS